MSLLSHPDVSKITVDNEKGEAQPVLDPKIRNVHEMSFPRDFRLLYVWHHLASPFAGTYNFVCNCWMFG